MYAQALWFDGPRSDEIVKAGEHAGADRIEPAVRADPALMADLVVMAALRQPDGAELVLTIARTEAALDRYGEIVMSTPLLPDEDPALLTPPDRIERYEVVNTVRGRAELA